MLNPVLVREMRQAVRSRAVIALIFIYLLLLAGAYFYVLLFETIAQGAIEDGTAGSKLSRLILWIAFWATGIVVLCHTAQRIISERIDADMMFVSTLKPRSIVFGKFQCGVAISVLLFSMTLPFLTIAYVMRGVDLRILAVCTLAAFLMIQTLNTMVLAFFAGIQTRLDAATRLIPFCLCAGLLLWFAITIGDFIIHNIFPRSIGSWEIFFLLTISLFMFVLVPAAMFSLASCQLAPPSANRMMPTRIFVSIFGIFSLVPCVIAHLFSAASFHTGPVLIWLLFMMYPFMFFSLIATCERNEYGLRLRSGIPFGFWGRVIFFPLYTGDCNAIAWLLCSIFVTTAAVLISGDYIKPFFIRHGSPICSTILLSFNYAVMTIAVQHILRRYIPKERSWMIAFILLCVGVLLSFVVSRTFFSTTNVQPEDMLILVPNPIWIYEGSHSFFGPMQLFIAGVWFLFLLPFVGLWIIHRFKKFVTL